jgi:hypothetical protein
MTLGVPRPDQRAVSARYRREPDTRDPLDIRGPAGVDGRAPHTRRSARRGQHITSAEEHGRATAAKGTRAFLCQAVQHVQSRQIDGAACGSGATDCPRGADPHAESGAVDDQLAMMTPSVGCRMVLQSLATGNRSSGRRQLPGRVLDRGRQLRPKSASRARTRAWPQERTPS